MKSILIEVVLECSICGFQLKSNLECSGIDITAEVEPCPHCMRVRYEDGHGDAKKDYYEPEHEVTNICF